MKGPSRVRQKNSNKKEGVKELLWSTERVEILVGIIWEIMPLVQVTARTEDNMFTNTC